MDKRSKEALRRYKKSRQQSSSDSSSSSESDSSGSSYSSSDSERHRRKKARQTTASASRRSSSSSTEERRKREKREHCQKKLEAKRVHLKRKLKEAKLKKRAAAAAAALSGHIGHRSLSPATQAKLKKLAERKHQRAASKERREREKHRAAAARERERERDHHRTNSRSPTKITKIRIHQDVKRQKSPPRMHHTMMSREKIIIQTRTRDRTPSPTVERQRHEHKMRHEELVRERERRERERERAEREAARDKERAEALARCQERQRERERLAREKLRREEEEKKYVGMSADRGERLLPRPAERELAIAASRGYNSRERSLEALERTRHLAKRDLDVYEREREYIEAERRTLLNRDDMRREREYIPPRRRELSPVGEHYTTTRLRDPRDIYAEEDRDRTFNRPYIEEPHHVREREAPWNHDIREREMHDLRDTRDQRDTRDPRDFRETEHEIYPDERERLIRNRERVREEWKGEWDNNREQEWNDTPPITGRGGFIGGPKRNMPAITGGPNAGPTKITPREQRAPSEPDWDTDDVQKGSGQNINKPETTIIRDPANFGVNSGQRDTWADHDHHDMPPQREKPLLPNRTDVIDRRWQNEWREEEDPMQQRPSGSTGNIPTILHHHRSERGGRNFRRGGGLMGPDHTQNLRSHQPSLLPLPVQGSSTGYIGGNPRFPSKNRMTYTNPNLIKKQHAALAAAKAAAQASAVAAASTAVAAAKAAAQSAANATTNPSILGQASNLLRQQHEMFILDEKPEAGEILHDNDSNKKLNIGFIPKKSKNFSTFGNPLVSGGRVSGELSEISDSDDDILNKGEKKFRTETDEDSNTKVEVISEQEDLTRSNDGHGLVDDKHEDDEMLDFEEISDGELEEDSRNKGIGDALGVDWASLIAETKLQAENAAPGATEQPTTAKQKWQPHRIILDMGISLCMAGETYAKQLLTESKQKLAEEIKEITQKVPLKNEVDSNINDNLKENIEDKNTIKENPNDTVEVKTETEISQKTVEEIDDVSFNIDHLQPLACLQVGERMQRLNRQKLILNACGSHSRALSARQDLKLRRQLCNLPAREYDFPRPLLINAKLKARALSVFQRTLEVK